MYAWWISLSNQGRKARWCRVPIALSMRLYNEPALALRGYTTRGGMSFDSLCADDSAVVKIVVINEPTDRVELNLLSNSSSVRRIQFSIRIVGPSKRGWKCRVGSGKNSGAFQLKSFRVRELRHNNALVLN